MAAPKRRILIVDDDEDLRRALKLLLSPDFEVREASDGDSGLRSVAEARPDLLLLDVAMPGMTGIEVLKSVRLRETMPVLMLTAQADLELARQALEAGADSYITKPFDFGDLRDELKRILAEPSQQSQDHDYRPWRVKP